MRHLQKVMLLAVAAAVLAAWHCTLTERDNIFDPDSPDYVGDSVVAAVKIYAPSCKEGPSCYDSAVTVKNGMFILSVNNFSSSDTSNEENVILEGYFKDLENMDLLKIKDVGSSVSSSIVISNDGSWSYSLQLKEGENLFLFEALDNLISAFRPIDTLAIFLLKKDEAGPLITVTSHTSGEVLLNLPEVTLSGTVTDPSGAASVTVNGVSALLIDTSWSIDISLDSGLNTLIISATDQADLPNASTLDFSLTLNTDDSTVNDITPPSIVLISPLNSEVVETDSVLLQIKALDENGTDLVYLKVEIGFLPADTILYAGSGQGDSLFSLNLKLSPGQNKFIVYAVDKSIRKNTDSIPLGLVYSPVDTEGPALERKSPVEDVFTVDTVTITVSAFDPSGISRGLVVLQKTNASSQTVSREMTWTSGFLYSVLDTLSPGKNRYSITAADNNLNASVLEFDLYF